MFLKKEIINILNNNAGNDELFNLADKIRRENVGDEVYLRGLIEFSNICKCRCKYCGICADNKNIERYRISPEDIILNAKNAIDAGYKTIVLQSGEDNYFTVDIMYKIISEIKKFDTALTLSIGERPREDYEAFKEAGADRYLIRIETTDKELYAKMHPGMSFENRIRCLRDLKDLGYEVGTGCLVRLPGQRIESLADDILFFKEIGADMVGIGPFIPHPDTGLAEAKAGDFTLALKVMALTRIMLKDINIPATTAMETLHPNGRIIALQCGANVIMPNVTMADYGKKYEIYPNKARIIGISEKIAGIGRVVSKDYGYRKKSL